MKEYILRDIYTIRNRGTVCSVDHHWMTNPRDLIGKTVRIIIPENQTHIVRIVKGVETFAIPYHPQDVMKPIGLLIDL